MNQFPVFGVQHTRAIAALTVTQVCMDQFKPENDNEVARHVREINAAIDVCAKDTKKKKMSAGTKRALDDCFVVLGEHLEGDVTDPDKLFARWSSLVWCASIFVTDVIATCPKYANGVPVWRKLSNLINELADGLRELDPAADERGTRIYLESFCAMDGCEYVPEEYFD